MLIRFGLLGSVRMVGVCSASAGLWMLGISVWQATRAEPVPAASLLPGLWLYCLAHGIHQPCGQTGVVAAFPGMAGAASALSGFVLAAAAFAIGALLSAWSSLPAWAGTLYPLTLGMALGGVCTAWTALRRVQREGLPPEALG
jgi:DHA1 family bicyclomycin/chloramphenicol resistance-like MFS transporter